jgi:hypothetical protein
VGRGRVRKMSPPPGFIPRPSGPYRVAIPAALLQSTLEAKQFKTFYDSGLLIFDTGKQTQDTDSYWAWGGVVIKALHY